MGMTGPTRGEVDFPMMAKVFDELRKALRAEMAKASLPAIAERVGLEKGQLSRFVREERGLSVEACEILAVGLGLEVIVRRRSVRSRKK